MVMSYFAFWFSIAIFIVSVEIEHDEPIPETGTGCGGQTLKELINSNLERTDLNHYKYYEWDEEMTNMFWFHIFAGFWTVQWIVYWSYAVLAGVFADWYFSPWKEEGNDDNDEKVIRDNPITASIWRITRFHMGTVAFGSLLIAIIRFMRAVLIYIETKMIQYENCIARAFVCCVSCILWCCDCCIDKLSKDGFIFTAVYGVPFCTATVAAFDMVWKHLSTVALLTVISDYVEIVGKLCIVLLTTGIMAIAIEYTGIYAPEQITSFTFVCLALMVVNYLVAVVFMHMFDVAIETMFVCYVIDLEAHGGKPKFATKQLREVVDSHKDENEEAAKQMKELRMGQKDATPVVAV